MSFLSRLFRKTDSRPSPQRDSGGTTTSNIVVSRSLGYNPGLSEVDGQLVQLLGEKLDARLEELHAKHLDVFRRLLAQPIAGLSEVDFVASQVESLVTALTAWKEHLTTEVHEMMRSGTDGNNDALTLFFETSVNATNYDALILESAMRGATTTFDEALTLCRAAYPTMTADDLKRFEWCWTRQLVFWGSDWKALHQQRFNDVYASWQAHQHSDSLVMAFAELCRAHFQNAGRLAVRNYRRTLLPVVTANFADDTDAMAKVGAALDATATATLREAAFRDFPIVDAWERSPSLARAYMLARYDVVRIATDAKDTAVADGRANYEAEIRAMDCDEEFIRLGEQWIDKEFAALVEEVRSFYVGRYEAATVS